MANLRYTRTENQTAPEQFSIRVEIEMDTDSSVEPDLEILNSFLTAITGERNEVAQSTADGWIPIDDTEE